jgi:hypothetical protein
MATEILRPNAPGDVTQLSQSPSSGSNWDKVDEEVSDGDATFVYGDDKYDLYNLQSSGVGAGIINSVIIYVLSRAFGDYSWAYTKTVIKTHGTVYFGTQELVYFTPYQLKGTQYTTNPYTGSAWTWDEINALQAGGYLKYYTGSARCTQVYVVVNFTFVTNKQAADSGSGVDAKVSQNVQLVKAESGLGFDMGIDSPQVAITKAETGGGVDASALLYELSLSEAGAGLDAVVALTEIGNIISTSDSGVGVEHYRRTILGEVSSLLAEYSLYDAATALEASILTAIAQALQVHDSGSGIDASVLKVWHDLEDSGTAVEALILTAAILANQTGLGTDKVLDRLIHLVETGTGAEAVLLVGLVGRLMKLLVYTRAYSNLRVYTKPYSDLRVFTKPYSNLRVSTRPYSDLRVFTKKYSDLRVYTAEVKQ